MGSTAPTTTVTEPIATEPTPTPTTSTTTGTGKISRDFWSNVHGSSIAEIPVTQTPTSKSELTLFEAPTNVGDSYAQRIRGYVTAPVSGNYTFWIASDDMAELYLSTSEDPTKKVKVASVAEWTNPREWTKYSSQKSVSIALVAGKRYYIEALHLEMGGGDNLAIGWTLPNGTLEAPIPGKYLSPMGSTAPTTEPVVTEPTPTPTPTEPAPVDDTEIVFTSTTAYPNPFRDMITLDFGNQLNVKLQKVVLVNQLGKIVYTQQSLTLTNNKLILRPATNLKRGLYILKYTDAQGVTKNINLMKD
jgi:hypothetical protein